MVSKTIYTVNCKIQSYITVRPILPPKIKKYPRIISVDKRTRNIVPNLYKHNKFRYWSVPLNKLFSYFGRKSKWKTAIRLFLQGNKRKYTWKQSTRIIIRRLDLLKSTYNLYSNKVIFRFFRFLRPSIYISVILKVYSLIRSY